MQLFLKEVTNEKHILLCMRYFGIYDEENMKLVGLVRKYIDRGIYDIDIVDLKWKEDLDLSSFECQVFKEVMDYLMNQVIVKEKHPYLWKVTANHFTVDAMALYEQLSNIEQRKMR